MNIFNKINKTKISDNEIKVKDIEHKTSNELFQECIDYFIVQRPDIINQIQRKKIEKEVLLKDLSIFLEEKNINNLEIKKVKNEFERYVWGFGKLQDLIDDKEISDIKIISKDIIRVKKNGRRYTEESIKFESERELSNFINFIAIKNKSNLSEINAIQVITDKTNDEFILRINITSEYINSVNYPYLHIRKIPKHKRSIEDLIKMQVLNNSERDYLVKKIKQGQSILFIGKGGSGKTTMINSLLEEIPNEKSGLVIQESEELFSNHPDLMFQKVKYSKGECKIQYTLKDLAKNGLLIDLDYFIIGEIKGEEALYLLNACYTGHACMSSIHGNDAEGGLNKLVDYMKYESNYTREELFSMLKDLSTLVFMKDFQIDEIKEIVKFDYSNKRLIYKEKFKNHKFVG